MSRPISAASPQQEVDAVEFIPQAQLPSMNLPDFSEIPEVPVSNGAPSLSAPDFPELFRATGRCAVTANSGGITGACP